MKRLFFVLVSTFCLCGCSNEPQKQNETPITESVYAETTTQEISTTAVSEIQSTTTTPVTSVIPVTKQTAKLVCTISRDSIPITQNPMDEIDEIIDKLREHESQNTDDEIYEQDAPEEFEHEEPISEIEIEPATEAKPDNSRQIKLLERKISNCQSRIEGYESLKLSCNDYLFKAQQNLDEANQKLEKANSELEKAKEKTVKTYSEGRGWHYAPDVEAVANAEYEVSRCQERVDSNTEYVNSWNEKISEYDAKIQEKQNEIELLQAELESLQ